MTPTQERQNAGRQLGRVMDELNDRLRGQNLTSVSGDDLANPVSPMNVPQPIQAPETRSAADDSTFMGLLGTTLDDFRTTQQERQKLFQQQADMAGEGTLSDLFQQQQEELQIPQNIRQLQDIQLQLADLSTESLGTQSDIARSAGQTVGQASREISAEQARNNVRSYSLKAQAAVLQGNIQTAQAAAREAVNVAYQDRQIRNQNLINQINSVQQILGEQRSDLLEADKRRYEADQRMIERVQNSVDVALQSGATQNEVAMLTDANTPDDERLALAQLIQARGATEMRDLQKQAAQMDLAVKAEELAKLRNPVVATRDTSVIEVGDQKQLIDTQTGEVIATFGAEVGTDEIELARDTNFANTLDGLKDHPGLNSSVGPVGVARVGVGDAFGNKDDFVSSVENVLRVLTLNTFAEAKEKGMTFGAMSQGEWDILSQSATKIAETRIYDKEGIPGFRKTTQKVTGYDLAEKDFLAELDKISNFAKVDALRKGAAPQDLGVHITDDGKYWTQNSDGSVTELPIKP